MIPESGLSRFERPRSMEIDLRALAHNYTELRTRLPPDINIIPALKANAYGHGAGPVARCLSRFDVKAFATGSLEDAHAIRGAGVEQPILMFGGALPQGLPLLAAQGFIPTIFDLQGAEALSQSAQCPTRIFVKVEGGHGRLGAPIEEALEFIARVARLDGLVIEGVYTHLAFFDPDGRAWVQGRLEAFDKLLASLNKAGIQVPISQAISSSGLAGGLTSSANTVSPGSLLWGISAVAPELVDMSSYRPVLTSIKTRLIHVGRRAEGPWVGVVPLGLADGYRDVVPGETAFCLINGRRVRIRSISLEHLSLDLDPSDNASVGDEVILLGKSGEEEITLADLALWSGTRATHVLMSLNGRMPYLHLGAES